MRFSFLLFIFGFLAGSLGAWVFFGENEPHSRAESPSGTQEVEEAASAKDLTGGDSKDVDRRNKLSSQLSYVRDLEREVESLEKRHFDQMQVTFAYELEAERLDDILSAVEEENVYLRSLLGKGYWNEFQKTPLFEQLDERQRSFIQGAFVSLGVNLEDWQIRELADFMPGFRDRLNKNRFKRIQFYKMDQQDPAELRKLESERHKLIRERNTRFLEILMDEELVEWIWF
ncbi:MAG: hypothetical protein DWQ01_18205 [Planctomycetota bacterium]|nr:MAG: hypothetical protein DWQ01_18205 [Planctomycetota bacterium]